MTITELREKSLKIANEARALLDTFTPDNSAEKSAEFDRMMTESDALAKRASDAERVEAREAEFGKIVTSVPDKSDEVRGNGASGEDKREQAFAEYLRGNKSVSELRAMGVSVDNKGGATVPTSFNARVISSLETRGPMLNGSIVNLLVTDGGADIEFPVMDDRAKAVIIAENSEIGKDDLNFTNVKIGAFKYTSKIFLVSRELLEDSAVDVAAIVADAAAARIARGVNEHLTIGTGVGQPRGIVTAAITGKTAATANAFTADDLIDLTYSVDPAYLSTGSWMVGSSTIASARKLKQADGSYVWAPGLSVSVPETLLGRPFVINPDMPATGTGAAVALFGDFKAYTTRQARGIEVRRLNERYADFDQVGFVALARFDGNLLDMGAVRALKLA